MATYRGSYIASAFRARIDCTVADKSGDSSKSVVTVKVYVEMATGAKDSGRNFCCRGAVGADSNWDPNTTNTASWYYNTSAPYLNSGQSVLIHTFERTYSKTASTQSVMCYGQVANIYAWPYISYGASDARGSVTIPALATSTVSYAANSPTGKASDVTGLPSSQAKVRGQALTLATATPSLANYVFDSWNTAANGSGTSYAPGDSYTTDSALALYAQWVPAQIAPSVTLTAFRSDSSGNEDPDNTGYLRVSAAWSLDQTGGTNTVAKSVVFAVAGSSIHTATNQQGTENQQTGTYDGTTAETVSGTWDGATAYEVTVTVTDSNDLSTSATVTVPSTFTLISFGNMGRSIGVGTMASANQNHIDFGSNLEPHFESASTWRTQLGIDAALIRSLTQWTQIATTSGTTAAALTGVTGYNELLIVAKYSTTYAGSVVIPVAELSTTATDWYLGAWGNSGNDYGAACKLTTTQITPYSIRVGGSAVSSNVNWTVYAR